MCWSPVGDDDGDVGVWGLLVMVHWWLKLGPDKRLLFPPHLAGFDWTNGSGTPSKQFRLFCGWVVDTSGDRYKRANQTGSVPDRHGRMGVGRPLP